MASKDSKYVDLRSALKAVGKTVFVNFYGDFKNTNMPATELAEKLFRENPTAISKNQGYRIARARFIFTQGWQIDALNDIINSKQLGEDVIEKAKQILALEISHEEAKKDTLEEKVFITQVNEHGNFQPNATFEYDNRPQKPKKTSKSTSEVYPRDGAVAENALRHAGYKCEANAEHYVFLRRSSPVNYTEPHHIVPLHARKDFPDIELDREQNIVSLCSNCHNQLHYGADVDTILYPIFEERKELLSSVGINITYEQLKTYYK